MNNDQKEYIVTKIEKYNEDIKDKKFKQKVSLFGASVGLIGLIVNANLIIENPNVAEYILHTSKIVVCAAAMGSGVLGTVLSIARKAKLEVNKEQLINLLNLDKLEGYENSVPEQEENIGGKHI